MKKSFVLAMVAAFGLSACSSVDSTVVSSNEIAADGGEAVAVVQASRLGLTAIFHIVDIVDSDLNYVVNKLLVTQAKAMGASRVDLKTASTTPRDGIFALAGGIIGVTYSHATGVAVK